MCMKMSQSSCVGYVSGGDLENVAGPGDFTGAMGFCSSRS